jgi:hypothetical protein
MLGEKKINIACVLLSSTLPAGSQKTLNKSIL